MKTIIICLKTLLLVTAIAVVVPGSAGAQPTIPTTFMLASSEADATQPGFVWRVHQVGSPQPDSTLRTEQQLAGLLGDNIADPNVQGIALGLGVGPSPASAPITFEIGTVINMSLGGAEYAGNFTPDDPFPGLPGLTSSSENVAAEILTWLDLPAGQITLGVNSDDGFKMTLGGACPSDALAAKVGEFNGGRGAADTLFSFIVAEAGLYAARCTWEQGTISANIEIFSVNSDGSRVLINDTGHGGIPAYRAVTTPARAYIRSVSPAPGSIRVPSGTPIIIELVDGATTLDPATFSLTLNGQNLTPDISKSGGVWTLSATPTQVFGPGEQENVVFGYVEGASPVSFAWTFDALWISNTGSFAADFDSGVNPPGTLLYGAAYLDITGGVGNSGVLKLTDAFVTSSQGWFSVEDFNGGEPIAAFHATFKLLIGGGDGADGFSFNFGNDITDPPLGNAEEGTGTGLSVMFDTYDNSGGEAPAIDVKCGRAIVASAYGNLYLFRTWDFVDVDLALSDQGTLDLTVNGMQVFAGMPVPFTPAPGRFVLGARNGGSSDNHWVDNLSISATPVSFPYVSSFAPAGPNIRWDALIKLVIQDVPGAQAVPASVQLSLNGTGLIPQVGKNGTATTVSYQPVLMAPGGNTIMLVYSDTTGASHTFTRQFQVMQYRGPTGNYYETVLVPAHITWPAARDAAAQRSFFGRPGHLATVTSYEEDLYLEFLRQASGVQEDRQLWVGGYQVPGSVEPGGGWMWVNNEGPFPGENYESVYANWQSYPYVQPDNAYPEYGGENFLAIGLNGNFGWNDDGYNAFGRHDGTLSGYVVEYEGVTPVKIDIKPGDSQNPIYLSTPGKLPVAILSSPSFDAAQVDPATVRFGHSGTEAAPVSYSLTDVNGDKRKDLLCTFNTQDTLLTCDDRAGMLTARLRDGLFGIRGSDSIHPLNCPQYALSVMGLQDVNKMTDLLLTVSVVAQNLTPPLFSQHIQCKSLDLFQHVLWTANAQNVALSPTPTNTSVVDLPYAGLNRGEPVQVQMDVTSGKNNLVLRAKGLVLFRPDLAIASVESPTSVPAGMIANIPVLIEERNGDLGATADVYLMEGNTILDWRQGVYLGPHQNATVVFSAVFSELGPHQLTVAITDVAPGDYDNSNNQTPPFALEVTQPPAYYYANYQWVQREYAYASGYNFSYYYTNAYKGKEEMLGEDLYLPVALTFPLDNVSMHITADGSDKIAFELPGLLPDYTYDDGSGYSYASLSREIGPSEYLYLESYSYSSGYQGSRASFYKYAGDYVYYSAQYYWYWGEDGQGFWQLGAEGSDAPQIGAFLDAKSLIQVQFVVQTAGSQYGGMVDLWLHGYSWDSGPYEYRDGDYFYLRTVDRGESIDGTSSGYVTP